MERGESFLREAGKGVDRGEEADKQQDPRGESPGSEPSGSWRAPARRQARYRAAAAEAQ